MLPADEGFDADDLPAANVDLRLVMQHKFASLQGLAKIRLQAQPFCQGYVHRLGIELIGVSSLLLRRMNGRVCVAKQRVDIVTVLPEQHNPDTGRHHHLAAIDLVGRIE